MRVQALLATAAALSQAAFASPLRARCTGPEINGPTNDLIKEFEGFVASPEPDPVGLPTVGYGHLCETKGCGEVKQGFPLTEESASELLKQDLVQFQDAITTMTGAEVTLNANQYGALVSWSYNVGAGAAKGSSLISRLNAGEDPNPVLADELPKWNKGGGKELPGLTRRRAAEVKLAQTATDDKALPAGC